MEKEIKHTHFTEDSKHLFIECLKKIILPSKSKYSVFEKEYLEHAIGYLTNKEKNKLLIEIGLEYNKEKYDINRDYYIPFNWKWNKLELIKIQRLLNLNINKNCFKYALNNLPELWFLILKNK